MSMTAPGCGMGDVLSDDALAKVQEVHGVSDVEIELVWDPPWDQSRISQAARLQLAMFVRGGGAVLAHGPARRAWREDGAGSGELAQRLGAALGITERCASGIVTDLTEAMWSSRQFPQAPIRASFAWS